MRWNSTDTISAALILLTVVGIGQTRGPLAATYTHAKATSDAYLLPSVDQTYVASLGYRSALADLIYGHVLVAYGLHFQDGRLFQHVGEYLDVINRLDPKFRAPYWFADTLLTLQPEPPPEEFYRKARQIQERGLAELPYDQALFSAAGQYIAYLAPTHLADPREKEEYRRAGARYLMQACNLVGSNDAIPYHCVTAAKLLNQDDQRDAAQKMLERLLTVSDDPGIQELAMGYLKRMMGEQAQAIVEARQQRFRAKRVADLAFSPRVEAAALGPGFDSAACAGLAQAASADCASSWRRFAENDDTSSGL